MTTWAIGDLQGCLPEFQRLLDRIRFDPTVDRLWLCGDLVNRGGESLAVLRLLQQLDESIVVTLGNHDLSLLAVSLRDEQAQARINPDLRQVLFAPDRDTLLTWLRHRPLMHHDHERGACLVHAGLAPCWSTGQARTEAEAVERALRGPRHQELLHNLFGNKPGRWTPKLHGLARLRACINVMTRMRYCDVHGRIDFDAKGIPGSQRPGLYPWFAVPGMKRRDERIYCGHWSALGRFSGLGIQALDTGCVWGGKLTAVCVDQEPPRYVVVDADAQRQPRSRKPQRARPRHARSKPVKAGHKSAS